jgi:hypothetical protein
MGGALSNFGYLCTVHKHGLCTITYAIVNMKIGEQYTIPGKIFNSKIILEGVKVIKAHDFNRWGVHSLGCFGRYELYELVSFWYVLCIFPLLLS